MPEPLSTVLSADVDDVHLQALALRDAPSAHAAHPVPQSRSQALDAFRLLRDSGTLQPCAPVLFQLAVRQASHCSLL